MIRDKSEIKRILLITLSNIGDVVLTLPVLGVLKREFPSADITVIAGPNAKELFEAEPSVSKIIPYDKHMSFLKKIQLALRMRKNKFGLVVDLRNSLFPLLTGARHNTSLIQRTTQDIHKKDKHLKRLADIGISIYDAPFSIAISHDDKLRTNALLNEAGLLPDDDMVAIAPGAKSHIKRWTTTGFMKLCERLNRESGVKALLVGDDNDRAVIREITEAGLKETYNLCGRTNIRELAYLLSLCKLLVTNDSAPLHVASALGLPTIAIFGPTDDKKYGPLAPDSVVIRKKLSCSPCERAQCGFDMECMKDVSADEVLKVAKEILLKI